MKNEKYGKGGTMSDGDAFVPTSRMKIDAYAKNGGLVGYMGGGNVTDVYDNFANKKDSQLVRGHGGTSTKYKNK